MPLLDTNHCSLLMEADAVVLARLQILGDVPLSISVIVRGELLYMVHRSDRRESNLIKVREFLQSVRIFSIDEVTSEIYGELKAALLDFFGPRERQARRRTRIRDIGIDDNDLWIAATAIQHDLTIVSADSDFARINEVRPLRVESWLQPAL